jgi:ATP synthase protein I
VPDLSKIASDCGEMPHGRIVGAKHPKDVPAIDPAARSAKRGFDMLSASSVGLEMGISVLLGVLAGLWIDSKLGTSPLFMLVFIVLGLIAGFRGVIRAMKRADRAAAADDKAAP